ncbi:MAG: DciA family protein [Pseudomonadota bacterium]|nr:DciA family protein [Pseudomonadota bacterium]
MAWSAAMAKSPRSDSKHDAPRRADSKTDAPRRGHARSAGDLVGDIAGTTFKRFGFVQGAVVSRWAEIVGERYAKVSTPESVRFPHGKKSGGTLTLTVVGAHAPLMQHLTPLIVERVNRFFGYAAVDKIAFRQGRVDCVSRPVRPVARPLSRELGEGLREIADPGLRACLESLAAKLESSAGAPALPSETMSDPIPPLRRIS